MDGLREQASLTRCSCGRASLELNCRWQDGARLRATDSLKLAREKSAIPLRSGSYEAARFTGTSCHRLTT